MMFDQMNDDMLNLLQSKLPSVSVEIYTSWKSSSIVIPEHEARVKSTDEPTNLPF